MATFLLTVILLLTAASALAARRGRVHGVFYWRGLRSLAIAALVFWATFADGPVLRTIGLCVAAVLAALGLLQVVTASKARAAADTTRL